MNELPVIESLCMRKDFRIATGQTLVVARKKCMAIGLFDFQKKAILERDQRFFAAFSSRANTRIRLLATHSLKYDVYGETEFLVFGKQRVMHNFHEDASLRPLTHSFVRSFAHSSFGHTYFLLLFRFSSLLVHWFQESSRLFVCLFSTVTANHWFASSSYSSVNKNKTKTIRPYHPNS